MNALKTHFIDWNFENWDRDNGLKIPIPVAGIGRIPKNPNWNQGPTDFFRFIPKNLYNDTESVRFPYFCILLFMSACAECSSETRTYVSLGKE